MSKRADFAALSFAGISFCLFIFSMFFNKTYFDTIAYDNIFLYEGKQLAAILLLFAIGFLFLYLIRHTLSMQWCILLSFPCGICLWCFVSFLELLIGIPYGMVSTLLFLAGILAILFAFHKRSSGFTQGIPFDKSSALFIFSLFTGAALLISGGLVYSFVSYDSFFYFTNYGHTLAILGNFKDIAGNNSFTLTNISQFLPVLNAYTSFWGLDQCYQMQAMLTFTVAASFFYGLYCFVLKAQQAAFPLLFSGLTQQQRAALYAGIFTLLLISSTSFLTVSAWVLANMYCMAYIFFLCLAAFLMSHLHIAQKEMPILIGICFSALTLLRKDGIIFAAFFFVAFCTVELLPKRKLAFLFLPAAVTELLWLFYVRVVLDAKVAQATFSSIANNKNIFFVLCVIAGAYLYLFVGHPLLCKISAHFRYLTEYAVLFAGMFLLFLLSFFLKDANTIIDNVDFVIRNMFRYPSSWGISALFFGILLALSLVARPGLDYLHFLWSGYAFLNLISYCIVDSKWFWLNWDDSYNRVLLQIVPVFVLLMAVKILPLFQSGKPDHNS